MGREAYALIAGQRYVLHDCEAEAGIGGRALRPVCQLDEVLPRYQGQPLTSQRVLVPFIGGQGDAIVLATCLAALKRRYPHVGIDVSCPALHHALLGLVDVEATPVPYPPPASGLRGHSFYMCLENAEQFAQERRLGNAEIFAQCLHTPSPGEPVMLTLPHTLLEQWDLGLAAYPRIGIAVTRLVSMKAYPIDLVLELARSLLRKEAAVLLLGVGREINLELPHTPPMLCNFVDRTPTVESLATVVSQLDATVCCDSLFAHLAGALRVPTLAVFTCSAPTAARGYPTVRAVTADAPCSPCGVWGNRCPQGHFECMVHRHPDLSPHRLCDLVLDMAEAPVPGNAVSFAQSPPSASSNSA